MWILFYIWDKKVSLYMYMLQLMFFISVNCCFSFVLNSLAYITIPKNNGKMKINWKKLTTTSFCYNIYKIYIKTLKLVILPLMNALYQFTQLRLCDHFHLFSAQQLLPASFNSYRIFGLGNSDESTTDTYQRDQTSPPYWIMVGTSCMETYIVPT